MKSIKALSELAQWFLQSELENVNFPPRRKTNQSTTNTNGQQVNGDVGDGHGILPVPTSSMELLTSDIMSHLQNEKEEASSCVHHFVVVGQVGFGKSTLLSNVLNQAVFNKSLIAPEQVVRISLKPHSSIFSLYSFFSKLAQNFNLRKDAAALEALEGRQERKDLAVLKVLKRFQLLCIDDIDADGFKILKHLNKILDAYDQKLIIVSTCLNIKDFQSHSNGKDVHTFLIRPLSNQDSMKMFESLLDLGIDVSIPETYIHLAKGIPSNICVISGILNYYQDVAYFTQLTAEGEMHAPLLCTLNKELDCLSKYLLDQLCQMKRPIPVHDPTVFEKLLKFGLVNNELRGGYVFVSATSSMQKLYPEVVKCQSHNIDNITQFSATELWKDLLSPKLREILVACQTRGDTFVPESWNSVKDVSSEDRYNVNDLINKTNEYDQSLKEYDIILECLYHALLEEDYSHCVALIFLIDRYTFWTGTCKAALAVLKFIEERSPQTPIPPQVVIRKARVLKNDGDIQEEAIENTVEENEEENGDDAAESAEEPEEEVDQLTKRGEDTMQTNIGYLFRGYSILEGNPLDPTVFDPGFKSKIFQATYEQNKRTDDQRYKIPDNVDILAKEACSSSFSSETVMTESDYQRSLLAKASLSASGKIKIVDASFSASSEYKRMSKLLKTNTKSVIRSEATCTIYEGRVQTGTPPKFSDNFLASVKILKEEPEYGRFLDTFGTHFVEAVDMGARFTKLQEISKETQEKLKEQGIDIKTTASISAGPIGSGSAEAELKISKDQKDKFEKAVEQTKVVTLGSKPPRDGKADTWISEAIQNPLPTSYRLRSITELFGAAFFTKEDGVDYKKLKADLTRYLEGYCKEVKSNRLPSVQCAGPPKGCSGGSQCSVNAVCNDNPSSDDPEQQYDCKCKAGYKGDGRICSRQLKWMPGVVIEQDSDRGEQGTWGGIESCENGIFANGFLLRAEKEQGAGDDSGANAVCLKCDSADICSKTGTEGEWSPKPFMCPEGSFLSGWRQNVEKHKGLGLLRDDTALDNVEYKCRDGRTWKEVDANMKGQGKEWGSWSKFKECPKFQFICGINTRVRDSGGDDTGLNDIKHQCCKPLIAKKAKKAKESKKRIKKY